MMRNFPSFFFRSMPPRNASILTVKQLLRFQRAQLAPDGIQDAAAREAETPSRIVLEPARWQTLFQLSPMVQWGGVLISIKNLAKEYSQSLMLD